MQDNNQVGVAAVCRIIAYIQHNVKLTTVYFDPQPAACVGHDAWRSEGLPVPPSKVVAQGWDAVPRFLRVRPVFAAHLKRSPGPLTTLPRPAPTPRPSRPFTPSLQVTRAVSPLVAPISRPVEEI